MVGPCSEKGISFVRLTNSNKLFARGQFPENSLVHLRDISISEYKGSICFQYHKYMFMGKNILRELPGTQLYMNFF